MRRIALVILILLYGFSSSAAGIRTKRFGRDEGLSNLTVRGIVCDRDGEMWFATRDGLNRYDGNVFTVYKHDPSDPASLGCNILESILAGADGRIWIGSDLGFSIYDPRKRTFENHQIPQAPIKTIFPLEPPYLFLKGDNGTSVYNSRTGEFSDSYRGVQFRQDIKNSAILAGDELFFHVDHILTRIRKGEDRIDTLGFCPGTFTDIKRINGVLWVSCDKNGLYTYNEKERKFEQFGTLQGLISDNVREVKPLGSEIWIATYMGIDILAGDGTVTHTNLFSGENDINKHTVRSIETDAQGGIWAGSFYDGAIRCSLSDSCTYSPPPCIVRLAVNGKEMMPSDKAMKGSDIRYTEKVRLGSGQKNLDIWFRTVDQDAEGAPRHEYILEGADKEWMGHVGTGPVSYQKLKPGNYTFRVRNGGGEDILRIHITHGAAVYIIIATLILLTGFIVVFFRSLNQTDTCLSLHSSWSGKDYRFDGTPSKHFRREEDEFLQRLLKIVEERLEDEGMSTEKLSEAAGMSRSSLHERLSEVAGISANTLISIVKFTNAKLLSDSGKYTLGEIADMTGFSNKYYFSSAFKKHFGYNPGKAKAVAFLLSASLFSTAVPSEAAEGHRTIPLPDKLKEESSLDVFIDRKDLLWIYGTRSIFSYDGRSFRDASCPGVVPPGTLFLTDDSCGRMWASTGSGLMLHDETSGRFLPAVRDCRTEIYGVAAAGDDIILVCTPTGTRTYTVPDGERVGGVFPSERMVFKCLTSFSSNIFLLARNGSGLYRWSLRTGALEYVGGMDADICRIESISDNAIWAESGDGDVSLYMIDQSGIRKAETCEIPPLRLRKNGDLAFRTADGSEWTLSSDRELQVSNPRMGLLGTLPGGLHDFVTCIVSDSEGNIWLGEPNSNIISKISRSGAQSHYTFNGAYNAKCLLDTQRYLYVGFYTGGLKILDKATGTIHPTSSPYTIYGLAQKKDGDLWVASTQDLYTFHPGTGRFTPMELGGEKAKYTKRLFTDYEGNLWIVAENGVYTDKEGTVIPDDIRRATGITECPAGTIWIATEYGLWKHEKEPGTFERIDNKQISACNLYGIECDSQGRLWISSSEGLFSYDCTSGKVRHYSSACGHVCTQYTVGGSGYLPDGCIAFCGVGGATVIDPAMIKENDFLPVPFLEGASGPITVRRGQSPFTIRGNVADYTGTENLKVMYMLEGFDSQWNEGVFPLEVTYEDVRHGKYRFVLKCCNADGFVGDDACTAEVNVRWSTFALAALFSAVSILVVFFVLFYSIRRRNRILAVKDPFADLVARSVGKYYSDKDFSVDKLASEMRLSRTVLYEKMARKMDTTPSCYIKEYRIREAMRLLESTDRTVQQIADQTGFASQSHFTAVFKKETGLTPTQYKKNADT